jgi:hypothetical protein
LLALAALVGLDILAQDLSQHRGLADVDGTASPPLRT